MGPIAFEFDEAPPLSPLRARRLEVAGLGTTTGYRLPMTQEQIADCAGLTAVHVNRTLKQLEAEGLIVLHKRFDESPDCSRARGRRAEARTAWSG